MNPGITSKYFSGTNTFFARLAEGILRFRWPLLLLVFLLTIFAFHGMRTLRMDNSNESFFLEGDPTKLEAESSRLKAKPFQLSPLSFEIMTSTS
jgi:hypothetical protein